MPIDPSATFPVHPRPWAGALLRRLGWTLDVAPLPAAHCLIVVYPHTSNWDFPLGLLVRFALGWPIGWIGKHTLFRWPVSGLLRRLGGIPVDRGQPGGFVEGMAGAFRSRDHLLVAIAPEGTRRRTAGWKSGFYRIARAADVPVGLGFIDYRRKRLGIAAYVRLTGNVAADMARIREVYAGMCGYRPDQASPVVLPESERL
ncbi:MAG TPA: 1-acyl-sn-glycerol-3-phosphate acyltransferase [Rhodocyclaceae bacterium]|uniref:1-acyl-sn-glycerol-3-phosphate acyltransferase n=1 Tax=Zoogloea sp. TaxID=49181 RepID=UPI002B7F12DE|nr:1-acyl-sn-glycerol-3-phosphate acyltransferase [Zoogloea sp.]HMV62838.1 1-acyl-sn-glycerol-3-phosphate acyltransferase [Rhodocyclaceae bacterium]HMW50862.1 1-acyl-sn-glycerol-3-phosphate acyltransferase [Rhodocyclaceae bacterium]HMY48333.1 1-acyl-sn-glycerol-3-phosphate acyltransferase [Rhodocyclaceae bacterium]HMZ75284.1 1-acyl-sn-glycerol-3-phosphate acyltransferase [Rhodocyclaceae bacterium]HNB63716.1 1-acyl-sn-glycerol-3-phosphate acyltransferase [Rhodocyclaceae bacterium]